MNKVERENVKQRIEERVFHIRLKNTQNELNMDKNSNFVKIIEQEYATKYLESLGIESTTKNIQMILKNYPLKHCQITAGWNNSGLYADTITIVVRSKPSKKDKKDKNEPVEDTGLDLKKMSLGLLKQQPETAEGEHPKNEVEQQKELLEKEEEKKVKFKLDFNIEEIKQKYLFPFNQSHQRKQNMQMQNHNRLEFQQNDDTQHEHDKFLIFESKIFSLPFVHIEIDGALLKDVQRPPNILPDDILKVLKQIDKLFPKDVIPIKRAQDFRHISFEKESVEQIFQLIQSPEMIKFIGLFVHLGYWLVFGVTQPIQVQALTKKQMYISMMEILEYMQSTCNAKLWMELFMPIILLTLKMATEFLLKNHYCVFFEETRAEQNLNTPGVIAMDKIFYLADRMFDQNNLFCRLVFLESNFKKQTKTGQDSKYLHKRIFAVSPYLDMLLQNPQDGRTRAIIAKQRDIDMRDKVLQMGERKPKVSMPPIMQNMGSKEEHAKIEQSQRQKMFNIVLNKMGQDLETVMGYKNILRMK